MPALWLGGKTKNVHWGNLVWPFPDEKGSLETSLQCWKWMSLGVACICPDSSVILSLIWGVYLICQSVIAQTKQVIWNLRPPRLSESLTGPSYLGNQAWGFPSLNNAHSANLTGKRLLKDPQTTSSDPLVSISSWITLAMRPGFLKKNASWMDA